MKPLIAANWKMNPQSPQKAQRLFGQIASGLQRAPSAEVVVCPPFVHLSLLHGKTKALQLGAQDCFWEAEGAYTGEVSPQMIKRSGGSYVIIGHSERKAYLGESAEMINKKMLAALAAGLKPIVCIGEKNKSGKKSREEVKAQLRETLLGIKKPDVSKLALAYEPEWAISTNANAQPATPERVRETIELMRSVLANMLGRETSKKVRVLYGGSTDSRNVAGFITQGGAEGALVGSASLNAREFVALVKASRAS